MVVGLPSVPNEVLFDTLKKCGMKANGNDVADDNDDYSVNNGSLIWIEAQELFFFHII